MCSICKSSSCCCCCGVIVLGVGVNKNWLISTSVVAVVECDRFGALEWWLRSELMVLQLLVLVVYVSSQGMLRGSKELSLSLIFLSEPGCLHSRQLWPAVLQRGHQLLQTMVV